MARPRILLPTLARILVVGRRGQVAGELARAAWPDGWQVACLGRDELDVTDPLAVARGVPAFAPDLVVNAAAITAVDAAETDPGPAWAVNRDGARAVALACAARGIPLVHLSTDYVFDGDMPDPRRPYHPSDPVRPLSVYGASKAAGEDAVRRVHADHAIVRTSWVFSARGRNFLTTMLRLAGERPELRIVDDQTGCPTSAADVAEAVVALARHMLGGNRRVLGTHHFCNAGPASWFDFARSIFGHAARMGIAAPRLVPIPASAYPTPARRPRWSVLDADGFAEATGHVARPWTGALADVMAELAAPAAGPFGPVRECAAESRVNE